METNEPNVCRRLRRGNIRRVCRKSLNDWKHLSVYGYLRKKKKRLARVSYSTIRECVEFPFSDRFHQTLAHGTKTFSLQDNNVVDLPKIQRAMSKRAIKK